MKKRTIYLMSTIALCVAIYLLKSVEITSTGLLSGINHWGSYLFAVPLAYCLIMLFSNVPASDRKNVIVIVWIGAMISILLSTNMQTSYPIQRTIASLAGAVAMWIINNRISNKTRS